jgi:hypothetical protein
MSDQRRDARGRFTGDINSMFRQRRSLHVGAGFPERNDDMNARLRAGRADDGDRAGDATPPALEGLDGGVRTPNEPDESTSDLMNQALRIAAGRESPDIRLHTNGLPMRD